MGIREDQPKVEDCVKSLQQIADKILPTKDPFLTPNANFNGYKGVFEVRLCFEHNACLEIHNLQDTHHIGPDLERMKKCMIESIRARLDAWEKE